MNGMNYLLIYLFKDIWYIWYILSKIEILNKENKILFTATLQALQVEMAPSLFEMKDISWLQYEIRDIVYTAISNKNNTFSLFKEDVVLHGELCCEELEKMIRFLSSFGVNVIVA